MGRHKTVVKGVHHGDSTTNTVKHKKLTPEQESKDNPHTGRTDLGKDEWPVRTGGPRCLITFPAVGQVGVRSLELCT